MTTPSKPPAGPLEAVSGGTQEGLEASAAPPRSPCPRCLREKADPDASYVFFRGEDMQRLCHAFDRGGNWDADLVCYRLGYERRGREIEQLKLASGNETPKAPYACSQCDRDFLTKEALSNHETGWQHAPLSAAGSTWLRCKHGQHHLCESLMPEARCACACHGSEQPARPAPPSPDSPSQGERKQQLQGGPAAQAERPQAVVFAEGMRQAAIIIGERMRRNFERIYAEEAPTMTEEDRRIARKFVDSIASLASELASDKPAAQRPPASPLPPSALPPKV